MPPILLLYELARQKQKKNNSDKQKSDTSFLHGQVLAVPSASEGFGMAYLEDMGFGLPAIASTAGAARAVILDGENGFLVPPGDPGSLADRISRFIADRELVARAGVSALRRHASHPTWEQSLSLIRAFLREFKAV